MTGTQVEGQARGSEHLNRALLAAIITGSEDAVISKTLSSIITSWNDAAERLFGWTAEEMIGQHVFRLIPTELHFEEDDILAKLHAGQRIERYETIRVRKDGSKVEVSLTISPIKDETGVVVGASKIAHDITERRRAEAALNALAEEAHALETLNRIGESVASELDLNLIVQRITDAATEISDAAAGAFFYKDSESGPCLLHAVSGQEHGRFATFLTEHGKNACAPHGMNEGPVRSDDIRMDPRFAATLAGMPPAAGEAAVASYLAVPVKAKSGEIIGGLTLCHAEPGVFTPRSERLVTGIVSQAAVAIENSRLVQALKDREARLEQLLAERNIIVESERAARTEAERLGQLKDEFLATLSHELRTPLNAVHGWSQILRISAKPEDRAQAVEVIDRNVKAQIQIINDLLDMSRIVSGKIELEVQTIQIHQVLQQSIDTIRQTAEAKNIRIQSVLDSTITGVRGDANRLQQVFWNLLTNAIKFTPAGGRIHIALERVNSHLEISFEDSGIGIQQEFLPFIFDRFRQGDASTTRRYGGLGLGLSIVKTLVELHGGSVKVKSRGENQGSTFVVNLPVAHVGHADHRPKRREDATAATLDQVELPRLDGARILVVDDEPDGRVMLMRILGDRGAICMDAGSAKEALEKLAEQHFDILLSDIGMPDMDGYELVREVRAKDKDRATKLPVIAITAYARPEERQRSLMAGFHAHLSKPVEARELVATVSGLLQLTR